MPDFLNASRRLLLPAFAVLLLLGCSGGPRPFMPSNIEVAVRASADVNPDARGRASPVMVRVYELKAADAFDRADFFTLNDRDQAVLGADLVQREEFVLQPGQSRQISRRAAVETRAIGVMVAYRAIDKSVWRASYTLLPPLEAGRFFSGRALQQQFDVDVGSQAVAMRPRLVAR